MLPNEVEVRRIISVAHASSIRQCRSIVALAIERLQYGNTPAAMAPNTREVILGLIVRAVKTARSAAMLWESGLGTDASVLLRSLFEVRVALRFVTENELPLWRPLGKAASAIDPSRPPTRDLRSLLYSTHQLLELKRRDTDLRQLNHPKLVPQPLPQRVDEDLATLTTAIGPHWLHALETKHHYSATKFSVLAKVLGQELNYLVLYRQLSWATHGGDTHAHAESGDAGVALSLTPDDREVANGLRMLAIHLAACMESVGRAGLDLWTAEEVVGRLTETT